MNGQKRILFITLFLTTFSGAKAFALPTLSEAGDFNQPLKLPPEPQTTPQPQTRQQPPYDPDHLQLQDLFKISYRAATPVLQSEVTIEQTQAQFQQLQAQDSFQLDLQGRYTVREYQNQSQVNPKLALHGRKTLYDFGRLEMQQQASKIAAQAGRQNRGYQQARYRLQLMKAYFDVLLADMRYRVLNEKMAVVYVGLDKARDLHEKGELSDVDLAKKNYEYQQILAQRNQASLLQQENRRILANLMGFPEALPDQLQIPNLKKLQKNLEQLPELDRLIKLGQQRSPQLLALQKQVAAQQAKVNAAKAQKRPQLVAEGWVGSLSGYHDKYEGRWRFDLGLEVPLYDAGLNQGQVAEARAGLHQALAQLQAQQQQLTDEISHLYFQLKSTQNQIKADQALIDFSDLYLDYSRGLYEWEEKTDLGDAMVQVSEADYQNLKTQLQAALNWTQLLILLGFEPTPEWVNPEIQQVLLQTAQK